MAQDMLLPASRYFHNCTAMLIQCAEEDKKTWEHAQGLENTRVWPHTCRREGRFPEVRELLFLRGEVPEGPWGHWVTSPGDILSRGESAQDAHQQLCAGAGNRMQQCSIQWGLRVCRFSCHHNSAAALIRSSSLVEGVQWNQLVVLMKTSRLHGSH